MFSSDQALNYLEQAVSLGNEVADWARHDVAWLDLRANPHFQALRYKRLKALESELEEEQEYSSDR